MANAVFIQNPKSIYDDVPGEVYHFPKRYLSSVEKTVGDWVILYQGRQGAFGYTAIQKISAVREDISKPGHYFADVEAGSLFDFETLVPRQDLKGIAFEKSLRGPTGAPMSGGHNVSAVRSISISEFQEIVDYGMCEIPDVSAIPRTGPSEFEPALEQHFSEGQTTFDHSSSETTREKILTSTQPVSPPGSPGPPISVASRSASSPAPVNADIYQCSALKTQIPRAQQNANGCSRTFLERHSRSELAILVTPAAFTSNHALSADAPGDGSIDAVASSII